MMSPDDVDELMWIILLLALITIVIAQGAIAC